MKASKTELRDQAWQQMAVILDYEMPVKKNNRKRLILFTIGSLGIVSCLATLIWFYSSVQSHNPSNNSTYITAHQRLNESIPTVQNEIPKESSTSAAKPSPLKQETESKIIPKTELKKQTKKDLFSSSSPGHHNKNIKSQNNITSPNSTPTTFSTINKDPYPNHQKVLATQFSLESTILDSNNNLNPSEVIAIEPINSLFSLSEKRFEIPISYPTHLPESALQKIKNKKFKNELNLVLQNSTNISNYTSTYSAGVESSIRLKHSWNFHYGALINLDFANRIYLNSLTQDTVHNVDDLFEKSSKSVGTMSNTVSFSKVGIGVQLPVGISKRFNKNIQLNYSIIPQFNISNIDNRKFIYLLINTPKSIDLINNNSMDFFHAVSLDYSISQRLKLNIGIQSHLNWIGYLKNNKLDYSSTGFTIEAQDRLQLNLLLKLKYRFNP